MKSSPVARKDMPSSEAPSKRSQRKAPKVDNGAKTSGCEQPAVATNRNPYQDKAVDRDANEPQGEPQASPAILQKAQDYEQFTAVTNMNLHKDKADKSDTKKPLGEPQALPAILQKAQDYKLPTTTTNINLHKDKADDGDTKKPLREPQASPAILQKAQDYKQLTAATNNNTWKPLRNPRALKAILKKAQDYKQPIAATNTNLFKDKADNSDIKKPLAEPQRWLKILRKAQDFVTQLNMGLIRMLGTLCIMLAPLLSTLLVLFFLFNILCAAFESACKLPCVPYISYPYDQSSDDRTQRFTSLDSLQSQLLHVQQIGASGLTLPMQLEYSKNVVREVAGIVDHSKVPSR